MLVNATFEKKTSNGIVVTFLDIFKGTIINQHLDLGFAEKQQYKPKQKVFKPLTLPFLPLTHSTLFDSSQLKARVLFVDQQSKKCALTALTHLISWQPFKFSESFKLGTVIKGCKVTRLDGKRGVFGMANGTQCYVKVCFPQAKTKKLKN
jgi:hypothetical protein